jgi:hypothetical protein
LLGLDDPIVEPSSYQCAARMFDNAYIVEEVIALIEIPQACSLKFLTCEQRSV